LQNMSVNESGKTISHSDFDGPELMVLKFLQLYKDCYWTNAKSDRCTWQSYYTAL